MKSIQAYVFHDACQCISNALEQWQPARHDIMSTSPYNHQNTTFIQHSNLVWLAGEIKVSNHNVTESYRCHSNDTWLSMIITILFPVIFGKQNQQVTLPLIITDSIMHFQGNLSNPNIILTLPYRMPLPKHPSGKNSAETIVLFHPDTPKY